MKETSIEALPSPRAKAVEYIAPNYYSCYTLQPFVLAEAGYPVKVEQLPSFSDEVQQAYPADTEFTRDKELYDTMLKISYDADFTEYLEDLSAPGIFFKNIYEGDLKLLTNHPVKLIHHLSHGRVHEIANHLDSNDIAHPRADYPVTKVTQQAFMTAFERILDLADNYPDEGYEEDAAEIIKAYGDLYGTLYQNGIRSLNPEQMSGIIADYYRMVENGSPKFRDFKNRTIAT